MNFRLRRIGNNMDSQKIWPRAILLDFYGTVVEEDDVPIAHICDEIAKGSSKTATLK